MEFVVVLGRKLEPDGSPSQDLVNRVEKAREVIEQVSARGARVNVILSGGRLVFSQDTTANPPSEASVMQELLVRGGTVDNMCPILDENATHTLENAVFARLCVEKVLATATNPHDGVTVVVHLVTSQVHMPRARACFSGVFQGKQEDYIYQLLFHASPDGARVIPSEREQAIECAMMRRLPFDVQLYREHNIEEARRRFFTPNPEGPDGEPHPHVWLHDPSSSGATIHPT